MIPCTKASPLGYQARDWASALVNYHKPARSLNYLGYAIASVEGLPSYISGGATGSCRREWESLQEILEDKAEAIAISEAGGSVYA